MLCHYLVFFGVMKLRTEFCHFFPIVMYQDISWTHYEISHIDSWFILFFLQNLSWHINGMKEHNQNFSLGIQIHVSFIWSILGIFLLLEIWSKLVIFYWNMICFIIIEKSFSVRISFLVTSFWNDILSGQIFEIMISKKCKSCHSWPIFYEFVLLSGDSLWLLLKCVLLTFRLPPPPFPFLFVETITFMCRVQVVSFPLFW